jgi:hypothetical protein
MPLKARSANFLESLNERDNNLGHLCWILKPFRFIRSIQGQRAPLIFIDLCNTSAIETMLALSSHERRASRANYPPNL